MGQVEYVHAIWTARNRTPVWELNHGNESRRPITTYRFLHARSAAIM